MQQNRVMAIDAVVNYEFADPELERRGWAETFIREKIGAEEGRIKGLTEDAFLEKMDRAGVEHCFLIATKAGSKMHKIHRHIPYEKVAAMCAKYPGRFSGLAGVDPTEGMDGLAELERGVREYGFVGAHLYPHWFEMAPDHARYYPIYAKCCELGVPIQMQVGHCLRYSDERPLKSVGRPITLDTIACDFPTLKLVGIHIGWPWTEEMIAVAYKHPNVFIGTDAYAPKHWDEKFVHYMNTFGQDKVLFGTDYPVVDLERARIEFDALGLRDAPARKVLRDNAIRLYGLKLPLSTAAAA
ncbi:amidohydrolase [Acuticoccus sediminis]|uniref:Amidohydrolase n=1 Tax=Acuticoccus sediminis TaxID=2184697 RepID=A0A8B2NPJ1_9HYPH|nr:amidohydrolase family protein [Acuticoccus sediminis]RAH98858.1 amidohydrolase [Acuticoccus sediminis]